MIEPVDNTSSKVGFAGLAGLASDVMLDIEQAKRHAESVVQRGSVQSPASHRKTESLPELYLPPPSSKLRLNQNKIIGAVLALLLIWCLWPSAEQHPPVPSYRAAATTPSTPTAAPAVTTDPMVEDKPAMYTSETMTANQLRYCLAESIRIDAASPRVDRSNASDVSRYNAEINDYNARCNQRSYHLSDFNRVKASVEQARSTLMSEGSARYTPAEAFVPSSPANVATEYPSSHTDSGYGSDVDSDRYRYRYRYRYRNETPRDTPSDETAPDSEQPYAGASANDSSN